MRLMHLADLHLDSPFVGLSKEIQPLQDALINAPYHALERAVSIGINQSVDVVIISGDIYNADRQTIYAQNFFIQQLLRLKKAAIPVVIGHGNHDYLRDDKYQIKYPDNVSEFTTEDITSIDITLNNEESLRVYGFSYTNRWIHERKIKEYPVNPNESDYTIGLLHGSAEGVSSTEGNYAPFSLDELTSKKYDYWALGHIHKPQILNEAPLIQYAGTPQGRHRNESGDKGGYIVDLHKNRPADNRFISLAPIVWQEVNIECQVDWQASDILARINDAVGNYQIETKASGQSYILTVVLDQAQRLDYELQAQIESNELMEALPAVEAGEQVVAIAKILMKRDLTLSVFEYDDKLNDSFKSAISSVKEDTNYHEIMDGVFEHKVIRNYLPELAQDESLKNEILKSSQDLIVQQFGLTKEEVDYED